jgi:hypothetical protein
LADQAKTSGGEGSGVLVVYGDPPLMPLKDEQGRKLNKTFTLRPGNERSFRLALEGALVTFLGAHVNVKNATYRRIRSRQEFVRAIKSGHFSHVIYYGHALSNVNVLLPATGSNIAPFQIADVLKESGVRHFDILGCSGASIAAETATLVSSNIQVGYLMAKREDNLEVDPRTMTVKRMTIDPQALRHFAGQKK